jgi:hypothetical protein
MDKRTLTQSQISAETDDVSVLCGQLAKSLPPIFSKLQNQNAQLPHLVKK